jgi:hypothetical protein
MTIGAIWGGGGLGVLSTPILEISTPKCVYVNLHLNTHYSLCIEKHNSFFVKIYKFLCNTEIFRNTKKKYLYHWVKVLSFLPHYFWNYD